jgi:hypothetical protein
MEMPDNMIHIGYAAIVRHEPRTGWLWHWDTPHAWDGSSPALLPPWINWQHMHRPCSPSMTWIMCLLHSCLARNSSGRSGLLLVPTLAPTAPAIRPHWDWSRSTNYSRPANIYWSKDEQTIYVITGQGRQHVLCVNRGLAGVDV